MQPHDDRDDDAQLRGWLREWKAPATPPFLEQRVLAARGPQPQGWWRFLLGGYIRVPVSVACALAILVTVVVWKVSVQPPAPCVAAQTLCQHPVPGVC